MAIWAGIVAASETIPAQLTGWNDSRPVEAAAHRIASAPAADLPFRSPAGTARVVGHLEPYWTCDAYTNNRTAPDSTGKARDSQRSCRASMGRC
jgi:hypothetical protein